MFNKFRARSECAQYVQTCRYNMNKRKMIYLLISEQ